MSLARAGCVAPAAVGQGSCWVLVLVRGGFTSLYPCWWCWAQSLGTCCACHPAHPTDLSHLRAQRGGGEEHGAGLCAVGRGVLLGPLCVGQRALVLLSSEARMWLPVPDLCQALMKPPEVGTVKAPVTAEPLCVSSGRQWHRLPACSLPQTSGCAAPCHSLSTP